MKKRKRSANLSSQKPVAVEIPDDDSFAEISEKINLYTDRTDLTVIDIEQFLLHLSVLSEIQKKDNAEIEKSEKSLKRQFLRKKRKRLLQLKLIINSILLMPKSSASNSFCRANRITMKCSKKLRMTKKYCTP